MTQTEKYDYIYLVYHFIVTLTKCDWQSVIILKVNSAWKSLRGHKFLTVAVACIRCSLFPFVCLRFCYIHRPSIWCWYLFSLNMHPESCAISKKKTNNGVSIKVQKSKSEPNRDVSWTILSLILIIILLRKYRSNMKFRDSEWVNDVLLWMFAILFFFNLRKWLV